MTIKEILELIKYLEKQNLTNTLEEKKFNNNYISFLNKKITNAIKEIDFNKVLGI